VNARWKKMHRKCEHEITVNIVKANVRVSIDFSRPGFFVTQEQGSPDQTFSRCFYTLTLRVFAVPAEACWG